MCVFVYQVDNATEPDRDRKPMAFTEVYLAQVTVDDFRKNARGDLGREPQRCIGTGSRS